MFSAGELFLRQHTKAAIPIAIRIAILIIGALLLLQLTPQVARAQAAPGSPEQVLLDSANRERAARGLAPLRWDNNLAKAARRHAQQMAEHNELSHQFSGEPDLSSRVRQTTTSFVALAENVAYGASVQGLHTQWMQSPPHRANLLDPKLNSVGIAVQDVNGRLFAVEDFSEAISTVPFAEQQEQLGALLMARGLSLVGDVADAKQICEKESGYSLTRRPSFQVRYSAAELTRLPDVLLHELQNDRYSAAAVAACAPSHPSSYSGYQIAILLYK
jgi:hypothetical protein